MPSLSNIPEPTSAYRPADHNESAPTKPLLRPGDDNASSIDALVPKHEAEHEGDEPQQQIDSVSCLLVLLIAGGVLRLVLGYFGPLKSIEPGVFETLADQGRLAFSPNAVDAFPLQAWIAYGLSIIGTSAWVLVAFGSLLTLAATPAAYIIGKILTGRRAAGLLAAALLALHPAVLTAANNLSGTSIALGLTTIGLALALFAAQRGFAFAVGGGITLALAGLAAPLCWVIALLAGPLTGHVMLQQGARRALTCAITVSVLALTPIALYRYAVLGSGSLFVEFAPTALDGEPFQPADRLLIMLTDPSLAELGEALHLPLGDAGNLTANTIGAEQATDGRSDVVADVLADTWLLMNAALASLAAVSVGVLLVRQRLLEAVALATPLVLLAFANAAPGETLRLPMLALVGVLAAGLLANRPEIKIDEAALAERAAKKAAKQAAKEEKERARQERELEKHKDGLYAFDKLSRRERKQGAKQIQSATQPEQPTAILTERVTEESSIPARPI